MGPLHLLTFTGRDLKPTLTSTQNLRYHALKIKLDADSFAMPILLVQNCLGEAFRKCNILLEAIEDRRNSHKLGLLTVKKKALKGPALRLSNSLKGGEKISKQFQSLPTLCLPKRM